MQLIMDLRDGEFHCLDPPRAQSLETCPQGGIIGSPVEP